MFVSTDEEAISELQAFEGATQGKKSMGAPPTAMPGVRTTPYRTCFIAYR
jgi:hypothetical protein